MPRQNRRPGDHGRADHRSEPIRGGRRRRRHHHGWRPEDLHEGGRGGIAQPSRPRRFLGDLVRSLQAAHADAGEGGPFRRRPREDGEDRHRPEPLAGAAARAARPADAIGADGRRLLAGPDRRPIPGRAARIRGEALRRKPAEAGRRLDALRRSAGRCQGRRSRAAMLSTPANCSASCCSRNRRMATPGVG